MNNELTVFNQEAFEVKRRTAQAMVQSGYFKDAADVAQAFVKIQAGSELGLPPFASMTGIHIIQGKPTLGANLIATLVKNDPRYNYRIAKLDDTACMIDWYEDGQRVGSAGFSMEEAKAASLTNKATWKAYPSDMLFARAISRGARRFAPGIFGGSPIYTPDELGADIDPDGYIEGEIVDDEPAPVAAINDELFGGSGQPATPQPKTQPKSKQPVPADWRARALRAKTAAEFCSAAALAVEGYSGEHHVREALEQHPDWDTDNFDQAANDSWLEYLKARKENAADG